TSTQPEALTTAVLDFNQLNRAVQQAIQAKQIGVPVFVRCIANVETGKTERLDVLRALVSAVQSWIGDSIDQIYAVESSKQTTLSLLFQGGATALVVTMTAVPAAPTADVIVVGNHGAIYHEGLASAGLSVEGQGSIHPK